MLCQHQSDVEGESDSDDGSLDTDLIIAACNGKVQEVADLLLLLPGTGVNAQDKRGMTALTYSAARGHIQIVRHLLNSGADVNIRSKAGFTPLAAACREGNLKIAMLLIDHGADVLAMSYAEDGAVPMLYAALDNGNPIENDTDSTTFHIVKHLLRAGADVNAKCANGNTPLHAAIENHKLHVVVLLLRVGADITALDTDNLDALGLANSLNMPIVTNLILAEIDRRQQVSQPT